MRATMPVLLTLSLVAGFADTATFIHLDGLFSAHVTGNFVLLAAAVAKGAQANDFLKLLAFPVFILGAATATVLHDRFRAGHAEDEFDRFLTYVTAAVLLAASIIAMTWSRRGADEFAWAAGASGLLTVLAMGMQNAMHRFASSAGPPTTVMTGNVTHLTVLATRRVLRGRKEDAHQPKKAFSLYGMLLLAAAFGVGCVISVPVTLIAGLASLALPACLLLLLAAFAAVESA